MSSMRGNIPLFILFYFIKSTGDLEEDDASATPHSRLMILCGIRAIERSGARHCHSQLDRSRDPPSPFPCFERVRVATRARSSM
jgi:hypothetical protein